MIQELPKGRHTRKHDGDITEKPNMTRNQDTAWHEPGISWLHGLRLVALAVGFANYIFIGIKVCVKAVFSPNLKHICGHLCILLVGI